MQSATRGARVTLDEAAPCEDAGVALALTSLFALLCVISAALQYNDPDPLRWIALYLAAGAAAVVVAWQPRAWAAPLVVAVIAAVWAGLLWAGVVDTVETSDLWKKMSEKGGKVEEMREAGGLSLVVIGGGLAAWRARRVLSAGPRRSAR